MRGAARRPWKQQTLRQEALTQGDRKTRGLAASRSVRQVFRTTRSGSPGFQIVTAIPPSTISTDDAPVRSAT
ncbi:hypothetical protein FB388_2614 [Pseudonocardia cypriaca]|uniref:Uncharacterized protein n=1 Tax=Pseudonocardia cypriaca TaxID=882449 RepID=A0A543GGL7_9PSEU|nr:hypothetical protein FB388_2614 [Pseudonocardia cypriaca]